MKISKIVAAAALAAMSLLLTNRAKAQTATLTAPVGWLTASPGLVRAGLNPTLKWNITYPSTVIDYVDIVPPAIVKPLQKLDYQIRVLGAGVTTSNSDGSNLAFVPTEAVFSFNGGTYNRIFYGTNSSVNPSTVVASGTATAGQTLRFGGRYYYTGGWSTLYASSTGTNNVRTLVNGDFPPTTYPLATAPTLENFIKPYLDASGRVSIGPMDVIVFMELTHTDAQNTQQGYDCQDMVLLVTFKPKN
ncbi:MAG: hypothetical protein ABIT37_08575 [Luteolibacter sp.]